MIFLGFKETYERKEQELAGMLAEYTSRMKLLQEEYEKREENYRSLAGSAEGELNALKARTSAVVTDGAELPGLKEKLAAAEAAVEAGRTETERLKAEIATLSGQLKNREETAMLVEEEKNRLIEEFKTRAENDENQIVELENRIVGEMKRASESIAEKDALLEKINKIQELQEQELAAKEDEFKAKEEALNARIAELAGVQEGAGADLESLKKERDSAVEASQEKDLEVLSVKTRFGKQVKELSDHIELKEKELAGIKGRIGEIEQKIKNDFEMKEEELKLGINRLQVQLKTVSAKFEIELKDERQKITSMRTEYALHEVQWKAQKQKEDEYKNKIAELESSFAQIQSVAEKAEKDFRNTVEEQNRRLIEHENYIKVREDENRKAKDMIEDEQKKRTAMQAEVNEIKENNSRMASEKAEYHNKLEEVSKSLVRLRKRFKFFLWLWYPNEPR